MKYNRVMKIDKLKTSCFLILSFLGLLFPGFLGAQQAVSVAAASNLSLLVEPLKRDFETRNPGVLVEFTLGSSGVLATQIINGAPFDLLLSADAAYPKNLWARGLGASEPVVYARGRLVLLSTKPLNLQGGLSVLSDPGVKQFVLGNPETAPYGKAALQALTRAGLWEAVRNKAVYAQTVAQSLQLTLTAASIGFVSRSALFSPECAPYRREGIHWALVDPGLHDPLDQAFLLLKTSRPSTAAAVFAAYLRSADAARILRAYGYLVP